MTVLAFAALLIHCGLRAETHAQDATKEATAATSGSPISIDRVDVGFRGRFKVGSWTEVVAHVTATQPAKVRPVFEISDPDGSATRLAGETVDIPAAGKHTLRGLIKSGRIESSLRVILEDAANDNATLGDRVFHVPASTAEPKDDQIPRALTYTPRLIVTIGKPAGFESSDAETATPENAEAATKSSERTDAAPGAKLLVVEFDKTAELPQQAAAFESLDVLALASQFEIDADRNEAVRKWVQLGGHLIVSVGNNVEKYQSSPISKWIPVPVTGSTAVRDLSQLEEYAGNGTRIDFRGGLTAPAAKLGTVGGVKSASGNEGPILVQVPYGFGRVTFLTLDLAADPLSSWSGVKDLVRRMVHAEHGQTAAAKTAGGTPAMLTHTGITDIATQIHASQDNFPQVERLSMWSVMGLVVVYLLIVGPIDYLIVHRLLRRPGLTWVTFPVIVATAAALGIWIAGRSNGSTMKLNELDVVDIDVDSNVARSRSWMTLYSPKTARYQVSAAPKTLGSEIEEKSQPRVAWSGVPENSYSGMYRPGGFEIARAGYWFANDAQGIENLPIPIWSTKPLMATWETQVPKVVECDVTGSPAAGLSGTFTHHLSAPLDNWFIAYGKMVYVPVENEFNRAAAQLRPGRKLSFSASAAGMRRRDLNGFLTKLTRTTISDKKNMSDKVVISSEAYNPLSLNTDEIFRILTFFNRAGGKSYTTLENNEFRSLDFSGLLELNRAVLFGKLAAPAADVNVNGVNVEPTNSATYVRIVIPVKEANAAYDSKLSEHKP